MSSIKSPALWLLLALFSLVVSAVAQTTNQSTAAVVDSQPVTEGRPIKIPPPTVADVPVPHIPGTNDAPWPHIPGTNDAPWPHIPPKAAKHIQRSKGFSFTPGAALIDPSGPGTGLSPDAGLTPDNAGPLRPWVVTAVFDPVCQMVTGLGIIVPGYATSYGGTTYCAEPHGDFIVGVGADSYSATWDFNLSRYNSPTRTEPISGTVVYTQTCTSAYSDIGFTSFNGLIVRETGNTLGYTIVGTVTDEYGNIELIAKLEVTPFGNTFQQTPPTGVACD